MWEYKMTKVLHILFLRITSLEEEQRELTFSKQQLILSLKKCLFPEVMLCGRALRTAFNLSPFHLLRRIITQVDQLQKPCLLSRFSLKFIKKCKDYKMSSNGQLLLFLISFPNLSSSSLLLFLPLHSLPSV